MSFHIRMALGLTRILFLLVPLFVGNLPLKNPGGILLSEEVVHELESRSRSYETADEERVLELVRAWSSAYSQVNAGDMAFLEANDLEIVDGFGELHHPLSRENRKSFWDEGFQMIRPGLFHPECVVEHIQFVAPEAAIVEVRTAYPWGIELKSGEVIPPFAEIHTFIATKRQRQWLIAAHIFVREQMTRTQ